MATHWVIACQVDQFQVSYADKILPVASNPFKLGSVKFQLQIINGWCTMFTNVEVKFVAARLFTINSKVSSYFLGQPNKLQAEKCGVPTSFGVLNAIIILPLLKMCPNLYYACPKQHKYFLMPIFMAY